jgi:hypothetical protein
MAICPERDPVQAKNLWISTIYGPTSSNESPRKKSMKSKKNLTRFSYKTAAFEGWRLCISRGGKTFMRYFPDKKFGGARRSLAAAERSLARLKPLLETTKRAGGKLSPTLVRKAEKLLEEAV